MRSSPASRAAPCSSGWRPPRKHPPSSLENPAGSTNAPSGRVWARAARACLSRLEAATQAPAVIMESPRGINDATLGAFSDLLRRADLIVLLGKALDFTTAWASGQSF